ncbi:SDR family oxidoreductase [Leisingera sp. ANG59]|uniref:SDR family oxidoreductase n=1 Tax=Leisingera sp. ANG59 TaxID=2675221 RepID=UPI0015727010|nr:NmrA family NAD(P)-binding protein [Leisingera sp. ANG59]NSY39325.1 NAD(P)H-binding protein [Leisingera sp. ANG59]
MKNILVIGATGPQGGPVAEKLIAAGFNTRVMVRDETKAAPLAAKGAEVVTGDLTDAASVAAAMAGQDGVFLLISFFSGQFDQARNVIDAAKAAGVQKIVWNATGPIPEVKLGHPSMDLRNDIYNALKDSGIAFVALQPTTYMENFLIPAIAQEVAEKDVLPYPMPEAVNCQWISHQEAANYVVTAFQDDKRDQVALDIAGPEKLNGPEIAARFGKALGREITFRPMPPAEFAKAISFGGNEDAIVGHYQSIFDHPEMMTTDVDTAATLVALPSEQVSIEDFAKLYSAAFTRA